MKILITGATGFIGNYVIEQLLLQKKDIIASSAKHEKAKLASWFSEVTYVPFQLENFNSNIDYYCFFCKPDIMIHLAWEGLPNFKAAYHLEVNMPRHFLFLENMVRNGLGDLTVIGTCFEYGLQEGCLQEDIPVLPVTAYGRAKNELRKKLETLTANYSFSFKWPRLFYMYGKGQNANSLLSQLNTALDKGEKTFNMSGGEQVRDFMPVELVAEQIIRVALQKKVQGPVNICSNNPIKVKDFVEGYLRRNNKTIQLLLGYYPYHDYEPMRFWGDNTRLKMI